MLSVWRVIVYESVRHMRTDRKRLGDLLESWMGSFFGFRCVAGLCLSVWMVEGITLQAAEPLKIEAKSKTTDKSWRVFDTWTLEHAAGYQATDGLAQQSIYGGDLSCKVEAKGYFYTKKIGDRWWLVDPQGCQFINVGICSVSLRINSPKAQTAFKDKFGSNEKWAEKTTSMMWQNGFNGSGSWSDIELLKKASQRVCYCPNWNFMSAYGKQRGGTFQKPGHTGYPNDAIFVFDPGFETFAMKHAEKLAATKNDPWLLGHFSDNELPIEKTSLDHFLDLPKDDHGYIAAWKWLQNRQGEKADVKKLTDADRDDFCEFMMDRYFSIVSKAIKSQDPNHLFLGCRYYGSTKQIAGAFRAAGKYCDVVSVNHYNCWTPDLKQTTNWEKWSGKPFMVTEFYAKGVDSGMPNTSGAGWLVKTQKDRGRFYQNFCIGLLESKSCVGWHYFKYQDNDMEDQKGDPSNRDSNKGLLNAYYDEYTDFTSFMKDLNRNVYGLTKWMDHGGKVHP
jgi:hypothetical protein